MVDMFGARMAVHFSPKGLGLSVGMLRIVLEQSKLDCLGNFEISCHTVDWPMCAVCVIAKFE